MPGTMYAWSWSQALGIRLSALGNWTVLSTQQTRMRAIIQEMES